MFKLLVIAFIVLAIIGVYLIVQDTKNSIRTLPLSETLETVDNTPFEWDKYCEENPEKCTKG